MRFRRQKTHTNTKMTILLPSPIIDFIQALMNPANVILIILINHAHSLWISFSILLLLLRGSFKRIHLAVDKSKR